MTNYAKERQSLIELATKQQLSAAAPDKSVWVEASAGTGKTKVLSDRVLRLLLAKVDPAKILCLTYTKAAAVEMNERIAKRLSSWAVEDEEELKKELKKLLGEDYKKENRNNLLSFARTLFAILLDTRGGMKIQTIHSFCQDILKRFPLEAGISPYFEVLDNRSAKEILQNIKLDLLKQADNSDNDILKNSVIYLTQNVSEFKFPEIMNMITENRSKISSLFQYYHNDIATIIKQLERNLDITLSTSKDEIKAEMMKKIDYSLFMQALNAFKEGGKEDAKRAEIFAFVGENNFSADTYNLYKQAFLTKENTIKTRLATKAVIKTFPDILVFMTEQAENLLSTENKLAALNVLHSTAAVLYIAKHIIDNYNTYKEIYASLDYEDLIVITRHLLENKEVADWVLFKLDGGIEHILIDEAQDTSPNQWAIIRALTQEFFAGIGSRDNNAPRTVFVVGDRKQSIYSFQGADPKEFDKMYHYFKGQTSNFSKIQLDVSFRSTKAVMDCVNTLFEDIHAKKGVIPLDEHINHLPFRLGDGGRVEILPLLHPCKEDEPENYNYHLPINRIQKTSLSNQLARMIAQNIKNMVEAKELLVSQNRPIRYGDFMFLVQQRNVFVEEFVRACKDIGVNVSGIDKLKLLEQIAVQDLISLGKFLLLPSDDLSLAEVLKSPLFMLDDDDLFHLCYQRKGSLFNRLLSDSKYSEIAENLKSLTNMSGFTRPFELFNHILVNLKGRKNFIARMGNEVEDVLDEFLNLTLAFEQKHTPSLETFINWIAEDEVIVQKEMEQGDSNTVKIMTVHGSKGLQAPIVILADTTRIKNRSSKSELLWDDNVFYFPTAAAYYDENCKRIKTQKLEADFEEYRRLLYVALTRAEDRLYIAGVTKAADADDESWYKLLKNNIKSNTCIKDDDKRIVYDIPQENLFKTENIIISKPNSFPDYSYLFTPAPIENPLAKPYAPSHNLDDEQEIVASPLAENGHFYKRGIAIHKLLQYICTIDTTIRESAAIEFIQKQLPELSESAHSSIVTEVLKLCTTYPELFSTSSMAEVPIIGEMDGKIISAKVDRLVISEDKVIVVDYKTNRPAAKTIEDVPQLYLNQLQIYKNLLQRIYPNKTIDTYILWTNTCNMMKI
ncbi:MAG: double-strand break repair helicase AddA [Acetobacter sp.]|nr:double-strand break repair helicase AddA [Acetobacter sp.]